MLPLEIFVHTDCNTHRSREDIADFFIYIPESNNFSEFDLEHVVAVENVADFVEDRFHCIFADDVRL